MAHLRKRTNAQRLRLSTCKTGALPLSYGPKRCQIWITAGIPTCQGIERDKQSHSARRADNWGTRGLPQEAGSCSTASSSSGSRTEMISSYASTNAPCDGSNGAPSKQGTDHDHPRLHHPRAVLPRCPGVCRRLGLSRSTITEAEAARLMAAKLVYGVGWFCPVVSWSTAFASAVLSPVA
jgi:hypothetical protein